MKEWIVFWWTIVASAPRIVWINLKGIVYFAQWILLEGHEKEPFSLELITALFLRLKLRLHLKPRYCKG